MPRKRVPAGRPNGGQFAPNSSGIIPPSASAPVPAVGEDTLSSQTADNTTPGRLTGEMATSLGTHNADSSERRQPKPYHKRFKNFKTRTLDATDALIRTRPSSLPEETRKAVFDAWITEISAIYNMKKPTIIWDDDAIESGGGYYRLDNHSITLAPSRPSVVTLLHEIRHALQYAGKNVKMVDEDVEIDARAWSLSLYYKTRPKLFKKLVKQGRIFHITEDEL